MKDHTTFRTLLVGLAACLTFVSAPPADAADFELTPFVGYQFGGTFEEDYDGQGADLNIFEDVDVEESENYGLILDIGLSKNFQLEFFYSRQESALEESFFFEDVFEGGGFPLGDVEIEYLHGGLLWQWANGQVQPFVVATAGGTRFSLPGESDTRFSAALGGGVKIFINDHVGFRFDGRVYSTFIDDDDDVSCNRNRRFCYGYSDELFFVQADVKFGVIFAF